MSVASNHCVKTLRNTTALIVGFVFSSISVVEVVHFHRFGHLVSLGLHADWVATESSDILAVNGKAKIYDAKLSNFGLLPITMTVCEYTSNSVRSIMVNYVVERRMSPTGPWELVPEWDDYGSRLFCVASFEITETHRAPRRIWPGRSLQVGQVVPAQSGFRTNDDGRFTVFLRADGNASDSISTVPFHVDKQP